MGGIILSLCKGGVSCLIRSVMNPSSAFVDSTVMALPVPSTRARTILAAALSCLTFVVKVSAR